MKYVAFAAEKGGVGKTTQAFNFAEWLANQGYQTLLIDMDQQASLSEIYGLLADKTGTSVNMFRGEDVKVHQLKPNLGVIAGSYTLDLIEIETVSKPLRELILAFWFQDHNETYHFDQYDYIIFDTHPDFKIITQNVIALTDIIISPLEPDMFGYSAKPKLTARLDLFKDELINPTSRETLVNSRLLFINNKVAHNTIESHQLIEKTRNDPTVIATIPEKKSLFPKSIRMNYPLSEMKENHDLSIKHQEFFFKLESAYNTMKLKIDEV